MLFYKPTVSAAGRESVHDFRVVLVTHKCQKTVIILYIHVLKRHGELFFVIKHWDLGFFSFFYNRFNKIRQFTQKNAEKENK